MNVDEVKKYEGREVTLYLKNGYQFTAVIPKLTGDSFTFFDKYGKEVTIECDYISMIYEKEVGYDEQ